MSKKISGVNIAVKVRQTYALICGFNKPKKLINSIKMHSQKTFNGHTKE